ncbi:MAG: metallopeptidase family protein [Candidatus Omnitrophota bacterium]
MTNSEFEALAMDALEKLPREFKSKLQNVDVVIEDEADLETARKLGVGGSGRLLGLYQGVPLKSRTHYYGMVLPDKITLFKNNIERVCAAKKIDISGEIRHVLQHEIAHHFGISDKRLRDLDVY